MAVNAATSSYVNSASSNKGFSGLASGVDTESMVEQLLSGTQSKIDKQEGVKQQLLWKQEIYRDIITKINAFQTKFFSYSSSTNLSSASFWNSLSVFANSSAFKASATSSATTGSSSISVRRLASKSSLTSGKEVSGSLSGKLDTEAMQKLAKEQLDGDYTVKFKVGDTKVTVDLKDIFVQDDGSGNKSFTDMGTVELDNAIQEKLQAAFKQAVVNVKVTVKDGAISITGSGALHQKISVSGDSGEMALKKLGLDPDIPAVKSSNGESATLSGKVESAPKMEFTVTLDDLKKTLSIDMRKVMEDGEIKSDLLADELQSALDKAHGKNQIVVKPSGSGSGFTLEVSAGRKVDIGGDQAVMDVLGMKNGASNRISLGAKLSDLNLGTPLWGDSYRFTINDVEFHFTGDTTVIDMMDIINRSDAGVRMVYRAQDDKFVLEAKESGAGKQVNLSQVEGNLVNALFGSGEGVSLGKVLAKAPERFMNQTFDIPAAPEPEEPTDPPAEGEEPAEPKEDYYMDMHLSDIPGLDISKLKDKEGKAINGDEVTLAQLKELSGGKYTINVNKDLNTITIVEEVDEDTDLGSLTLEQLGINVSSLKDKDGNAIAPDNTTLADLGTATGGKLYFDTDNNTLAWNGLTSDDGYTVDVLEELFGKGIADGADDLGDTFVMVDGQNAQVEIDGVITERSSNNFTINGINYDVSDITGSYSDIGLYSRKNPDGSYTYALDEEFNDIVDPGNPDDLARILEAFPELSAKDLVQVDGEWKRFTGTATNVTVKQDTDTIINAVKEFIDEYNVLVKTLNDLLDEDTNYREYQPLTAAQKREMSDREIELWEQKAKEGLLHRDSNIQDFLQEMRTALYQKPAGAGYALYELGIETGEWELKGQLAFTVNGETNLRSLLENDPQGVASLFTTVGGLGEKLSQILKQTASTSSATPGTLVQIAGIKGNDKTSSMYNQMKSIDDKIEALKRQYEMEKSRYWKQFNSMEQMISNMNTQSAYLAQMMGLSY